MLGWPERVGLLTSEAVEFVDILSLKIHFGIAAKWNVINSVRPPGTKLFVLSGLDFREEGAWERLLGRRSLIVISVIVVAACFRIVGSGSTAAGKWIEACFWCLIIVDIGIGKSLENVEDIFRPISSL